VGYFVDTKDATLFRALGNDNERFYRYAQHARLAKCSSLGAGVVGGLFIAS
jgi:hypothetical protein